MYALKRIQKFWLLASLCGISVHSYGQRTQSFDGLNSLWAIEKAQVVRYDLNGNRLAQFSSVLYGIPSSVDASDPFRILLFYHEQQMVVVLGSNATMLGSALLFNRQPLGTIAGICRSRQGGLWAYSETNRSVYHFDGSLRPDGVSISIPLDAQNQQVTCMQEHGDSLFLGFDNGIIVGIDLYGFSWRKHNTGPHGCFSIEGGEIWTLHQGVFGRYSLGFSNTLLKSGSKRLNHLPFVHGPDTLYFDKGRFWRVE